MSDINNLEASLNAFNIRTIQLSEESKSNVFSDWQKHFLPPKYFNDNHKTEWHAFSFNLLPHISGKSAIEAFEHLFIKRFFIHSSNPKAKSLDCLGENMPPYNMFQEFLNSCPFGQDLYIHHHNFKWTFVITHENDFGPYFCDSPYSVK